MSQQDILKFIHLHGIVTISEIKVGLSMSQVSANRKVRQLSKAGFVKIEYHKNNVIYVRCIE